MAEQPSNCPICGDPAVRTTIPDAFEVDCRRCTRFRIMRTAEVALRGEPLVGQQKANASGWLRSQDEASISSDDLPRLRALRTPSIPERGRLLLQYLASTNPAPGAHIQIKFGSAEVQAVARSEGDQVGPLAIPFIVVEYLIKQRGLLLAFSHENMQGLLATISPAGWTSPSRRRFPRRSCPTSPPSRPSSSRRPHPASRIPHPRRIPRLLRLRSDSADLIR